MPRAGSAGEIRRPPPPQTGIVSVLSATPAGRHGSRARHDDPHRAPSQHAFDLVATELLEIRCEPSCLRCPGRPANHPEASGSQVQTPSGLAVTSLLSPLPLVVSLFSSPASVAFRGSLAGPSSRSHPAALGDFPLAVSVARSPSHRFSELTPRLSALAVGGGKDDQHFARRHEIKRFAGRARPRLRSRCNASTSRVSERLACSSRSLRATSTASFPAGFSHPSRSPSTSPITPGSRGAAHATRAIGGDAASPAETAPRPRSSPPPRALLRCAGGGCTSRSARHARPSRS